MSQNLAAVIPSAKVPLDVRKVDSYKPGSREILVKNTAIAINPVEWKVAKLAIFPIQYPAILGSSFGGIVEAVGPGVTRFKVGDHVAVKKSSTGNQYGAYQQYALAVEDTAVKLSEDVTVEAAASVIANIATVVGALTARGGLDKASLGRVSAKGKKILVYGGSSNLGSLAIQYATSAGYTVVSTSSPQNNAFVSTLGAAKIVDHTLPQEEVVSALKTEGPYEFAFDAVSLSPTISTVAAVLAAQGGGKLYAVLPPQAPETLPKNVETIMDSYSAVLEKPEQVELRKWLYETYLPQGLASGKIVPSRLEKSKGGLKGLNDALDRLSKGVSGIKLIANPFED